MYTWLNKEDSHGCGDEFATRVEKTGECLEFQDVLVGRGFLVHFGWIFCCSGSISGYTALV